MEYYRGSDQPPALQPPDPPATMTNPSAAPATETCAQRVPAHAHTDGSLGRNQQGGRSGLRSATLLVASVLWLGQTAAAQQPPYLPAPPAAKAQPSRSAPPGP